jgi:hypothetical protein
VPSQPLFQSQCHIELHSQEALATARQLSSGVFRECVYVSAEDAAVQPASAVVPFWLLSPYRKHVLPSLREGAISACISAPLCMVVDALRLLWLVFSSWRALAWLCRLCGAAASWAARRPAGQAARRQLELAVARGVALLDVAATRAATCGCSLLQGGKNREACSHALGFALTCCMGFSMILRISSGIPFDIIMLCLVHRVEEGTPGTGYSLGLAPMSAADIGLASVTRMGKLEALHHGPQQSLSNIKGS